MDISRGQLGYCPGSCVSRRPSVCLPFGADARGAMGKGWILSGEKRLCPELFHSMIVSVNAKKT